MPLTTVPVTVLVKDSDGAAVSGATVTCVLNTTDVDITNGFVFPELYEGTTDANGSFVINIWPNTLGVRSSYYKFSIVNPRIGKIVKLNAQVPNAASSLHVIGSFVSGSVAFDSSLVSVQDIYNARDDAAASAVAAAASASAASGSASAASSSASAASGSASTASTQASNASASAVAAAASAATAASTAAGIQLISPGRNLLVNGNFDFWQRATTSSGNGITAADRWNFAISAGATMSQARAVVSLADSVLWDAPADYALQMTCAGVDGLESGEVQQSIWNGTRLTEGRRVSVSFWARTSLSSAKVYFEPLRDFGTGGSPSALEGIGVGVSFTLTPTWQRFTTSFDVPSVAGKTFGTSQDDKFWFRMLVTGGSALAAVSGGLLTTNNGEIYLGQVKVEIADTPTRFEDVIPHEEFNRCRQYYQTSTTDTGVRVYFSANVTSGTAYIAPRSFPVPFITTPTVVLSAVSANNFPAGVGTATSISRSGFYETRTANGTGLGQILTDWIAKVE